MSDHTIDMFRKGLIKASKEFSQTITVTMNLIKVKYLNITLHMKMVKYYPCKKFNKETISTGTLITVQL